jgi:23S rRNA pseudouridine1911/1915/1917 synthase
MSGDGAWSEVVHARRACAWPRRPQNPARVRLVDAAEVRSWIVHEDETMLVVNKPGDVVCHPSKAGPWSSLVGALREYTGLPTMHLVFRLDRETSGIVVLAKEARMAGRLQTAMGERRIGKCYLAVLRGRLDGTITVQRPLGDDVGSPVFTKTAVVGEGEGRPAETRFEPLAVSPTGEYTLARVVPATGRKHQIRAHAQWLGHPLIGDKIYGPDARLYLEFVAHGWTPELAARLLLPRQALHCAAIDLTPAGLPWRFAAPLPDDLAGFCRAQGIVLPAGI